MSKVVTQDDLFKILNGYETKLRRLEQAQLWPGMPTLSDLPDQPYDGQQIFFQTSAMETLGISPWHLRYRATNADGSTNANADKWEPIGECSHEQATGVDEVMADTANAVTDFTGPLSFTLPLRGYYVLEGGAAISPPGSVQANLYMYVQGTSQFTDAFIGTGPYGSKLILPAFVVGQFSAGHLVKLRGSTNGNSVTWLSKWLKVKPVRVG